MELSIIRNAPFQTSFLGIITSKLIRNKDKLQFSLTSLDFQWVSFGIFAICYFVVLTRRNFLTYTFT